LGIINSLFWYSIFTLQGVYKSRGASRDVIVPNGSVDIQEPISAQKVSRYSTRKQDQYENYEHYYISGSK